ncbi:MAG: hypothetical protein JSU94_13580 [Phycisphaerales bacterium]|nr:MAG: hypothetical protein JSU94_13580 [Phycisphaerales bacterium]
MKGLKLLVVLVGAAALTGCAGLQGDARMAEGTFGDDIIFLKKHTEVILLSDTTGNSLVAVSPQMQGRVLTSTAEAMRGLSFGWINRQLIASGKIAPHINVFGGEDRFWLGPEGGQFSIFFEKGVPFDLEHWFTPAPIDTEPFDLVSKSGNTARFRKDMQLKNYSDAVFSLRVDREVRVLEKPDAVRALGVTPPQTVKMVAFESTNRITNTGENAWRKETGVLSIWILGMFNPSPKTTIVIPFQPGPEERLGPIVNDAYFGKVPADRLLISDDVMFFSGDGQYRSKIGLSPQRAKPVAGSYDAVNKVLTIVQYNKPDDVTDYVNSMWELQDHPYKGDVVNSYNDGPPEPGAKPLGPFYELETSSPAAALDKGRTLTHVHRTYHLQGSKEDLDPVAKTVLGVTVAEIESAFAG